MGLVRSFLYAGARALVASEWSVEDTSTLLLMALFYEELINAQTSLAAALQSAQRQLRELSVVQAQAMLTALGQAPLSIGGDRWTTLPPHSLPFAHPRYWAAFYIVGSHGSVGGWLTSTDN